MQRSRTSQRSFRGDYEFLHLHQMGAFLVLNTDRGARELANSFALATASDDRIFICEIGQDWHALGLNKAADWLQNHLATKCKRHPPRKKIHLVTCDRS